jgi:hypothetical protein
MKKVIGGNTRKPGTRTAMICRTLARTQDFPSAVAMAYQANLPVAPYVHRHEREREVSFPEDEGGNQHDIEYQEYQYVCGLEALRSVWTSTGGFTLMFEQHATESVPT